MGSLCARAVAQRLRECTVLAHALSAPVQASLSVLCTITITNTSTTTIANASTITNTITITNTSTVRIMGGPESTRGCRRGCTRRCRHSAAWV